MIELAQKLEGEHDFTSFAAADDTDTLGRSKVRQIFSSEAFRQSDRLIYRVRGSGFLKHMVRNIVGVLLEAGKGNIPNLDAHLNSQNPSRPHRPRPRLVPGQRRIRPTHPTGCPFVIGGVATT